METDPFTRKIADLDNDDKPREKALKHGVEHLTNTELIAIVLGSGLPGMSVLDLSRDILNKCDNKLSRLSRMSIHELISKHKGVGAAKAISLMAAIELGSRSVHCLATENDDFRITSSKDIYNYVSGKMERLNHEEFHIIFLNRANRIIAEECVSKGGLASTVVDLKLILKRALDKLATSIAIVHNHPSGNLKPSVQDDNITNKIKQGAAAIDLTLIDHVIVGQNGYYSYHDEGRL